MMSRMCVGVLSLGLCAMMLSGCGGEEDDPFVGDPCPAGGCDDLELGDVKADQKTDGNWTEALKCKPIPDLEPLNDPMIVVSLDGLTLRLVDRAGDYEKVFPIGPGAIGSKGTSLTPLSIGLPEGVFHTRTDKPAKIDNTNKNRAIWAWNYSCRIWGKGLPYFAGLPFIRLEGPPSVAYGMHGPIDKYTLENGGELRRGYVSHGCLRMAADDIVEVFALIQGHRTPVRVQQVLDRKEDGTGVDLEENWLMSECQADEDCRFDGGRCDMNAYSGRGFCTQKCERFCDDRPGYPTTRCVADPNSENGEGGMCLPQPSGFSNGCKRYGDFVEAFAPAHGVPTTQRDVCLPGPKGWIGSRCLDAADCDSGVCAPLSEGEAAGVCTQPCDQFCPDAEGAPGTFCVNDPGSEEPKGQCVATCGSDQDCPLGLKCAEQARFGDPDRVQAVCTP